MSYKNTMKLFASNFTLVWKQVLYFVICLIIFVPITYAVSKPILQIFNDNAMDYEVQNALASIYTFGSNDGNSVIDLIKDILRLIASNFLTIYPNLILALLFGFLLPFVFMQISSYNLCSILYKKLSMNISIGYMQNLIKTLKYSLPYASMNIIFRLPFWAITILAIELYLFASTTSIGAFIGLICLSAVLIIVNALKHTFFSNYTAICVEKECSPIIGFVLAFPITLKNFWYVLASCIVFHITILVVNSFVALFTFVAGLLLMIPATYVITAIFYDVTYLNKTGNRYYLGNNYIFNPVKYSVKRDEYADKMLDPEEPIEEQYTTSISSFGKNKSDIKNKK